MGLGWACDEGTEMRNRLMIVFLAGGLVLAACAGSATDTTEGPETGGDDSTASTNQPSEAAAQYDIPDPEAGLWVLIDENQLVEDLRPTEDEDSEPTATGDDTTEPSDSIRVPLEAPPSTVTPPAVGNVPDSLLQAVIADAADRSGSAESALEVVRAQAVTWNDGSLGCPSPGQMYTQALVSGYWIVVEIDEREYDYRASLEGYFKLCVGGGIDPYAVDR